MANRMISKKWGSTTTKRGHTILFAWSIHQGSKLSINYFTHLAKNDDMFVEIQKQEGDDRKRKSKKKIWDLNHQS